MAKNRKRRSLQDRAREALVWLDGTMIGPPVNELPRNFLPEFRRILNDLWETFHDEESRGVRDHRAIDMLVDALGWDESELDQLRAFAARSHADRSLPKGMERDTAALARIRGALSNLAAVGRRPKNKDDTKRDTPKRKKKKLAMTVQAADCARLYRDQKRTDPTVQMTRIVDEYAKEHGKSATYIKRVLSDNPSQWKTPG